ncbi:hypothetical protein FA15DRAFT_667363 [Coprinopsis marcescibilis]|uniref:Non-structural maintenance of chromosomes element 4 n=1 Tax=Coprinopsis marcescibilis TaxID=230819 RepID=A0A5C3LDJ1_COPMA|nr:hypothetical protein FA15DRAFT_667363 [Coprinopsis marcescibilis]
MPVDADMGDLVFDPDQDPEEKRALRQNYRALTRQVEAQHSNPNEFTAADLLSHVQRADTLFAKVKEPQEAILDSHLLVMASNVGAQKARSMKSGSGAFDVDDFIAKLVIFMGGQAQARENLTRDSFVETGPSDTPLDWHKIGQKALAKSRRAPAISFMLGPLSIEQKKRAQTKRARFEKNKGEETKPQQIKEEDIQRSENETTKNVLHLEKLLEEMTMDKVNLFQFVINPRDFAQSVENMFYLSFLIRDGKVALDIEEDGEPLIYACEAPTDADYADKVKKRQMVMELDMDTWRKATEVFQLKEPMIPQRPPAKTKIGQWYG